MLVHLYRHLGIPEGDQIRLLLASDCVYNEALVTPFVTACADICALAPSSSSSSPSSPSTFPTVCLVAMQIRAYHVHEQWLTEFHAKFRVWRLDGSNVGAGLGENSGFVVYVGILRDGIEGQ